MLFQVSCFIITSFGNMQPSQQMCLNFLRHFAFVVAEPVAGVAGDVQFAVRVGREAVAAGFVVGAGAVDGGVVLGDVEIDGPGTKGLGQLLHRSVEGGGFPMEIFRDDAVLGRVVAEGVKERVGHVGLESDELGLANFFEELDHVFPTVHAAPADFAFGSEAFAVILRDFGGFFKCLGDALGVVFRVFVPIGYASGGVDADDAVGSDAEVAKFFCDAAGFLD